MKKKKKKKTKQKKSIKMAATTTSTTHTLSVHTLCLSHALSIKLNWMVYSLQMIFNDELWYIIGSKCDHCHLSAHLIIAFFNTVSVLSVYRNMRLVFTIVHTTQPRFLFIHFPFGNKAMKTDAKNLTNFKWNQRVFCAAVVIISMRNK